MTTPEGISEELWRGIRGARLWSSASDEALEWLARTARTAEYAKGDMLFREGEIPEYVGVILAGHARALYGAEGHRLAVETYWPGDVIGPIATLASIGFESDVEAVEPLSMALIPAGAIKDLLKSEPGVAMSVIDDLARRWTSALAMAKRSNLDVTQRIAEYLNALPHTRLGEDAYSVEIPMARVELAPLLGTTPETLSRTFHTLEEQGLIEAHDRMIIVPSGEALLGDSNPGSQ
ncbi:MAG: Crp/Fnr family transcriptional regulator [Coriobacteriia bacterium]|nr:Crp/Fnr family transcriptional regulator [Coriobacteriia bacterium]